MENEAQPKKFIVIVVPAHGIVKSGGEYLPTPTGLERILGALAYREQLEGLGHGTMLIFSVGQSGREDLNHTSDVMKGVYEQLDPTRKDFVISIHNSNETKGDVESALEHLKSDNDIPKDAEVHFLSHEYHNFSNRFDRILEEVDTSFTTKFVPLERMNDPLGFDFNPTPESLRFNSPQEIVQAMALALVATVDRILGSKLEKHLYKGMQLIRNRNQS